VEGDREKKIAEEFAAALDGSRKEGKVSHIQLAVQDHDCDNCDNKGKCPLEPLVRMAKGEVPPTDFKPLLDGIGQKLAAEFADKADQERWMQHTKQSLRDPIALMAVTREMLRLNLKRAGQRIAAQKAVNAATHALEEKEYDLLVGTNPATQKPWLDAPNETARKAQLKHLTLAEKKAVEDAESYLAEVKSLEAGLIRDYKVFLAAMNGIDVFFDENLDGEEAEDETAASETDPDTVYKGTKVEPQ
jgi:hypothetical protein